MAEGEHQPEAEPDTRLVQLCMCGSVEDVQQSLSSGADANCVDGELSAPLMWACSRRDDWQVAEEIVRLLLANGALVSQTSRRMYTALHFAALWSSRAVVTLLLEAKSPVDASTADDDTPLSLCCDRDRDEEETLGIARLLLDRGARIDMFGGLYKRTPLLSACLSGTAALVELLLSRRADVSAVDEGGETALMAAASNRMHGLDMIPLLVAAGVDVQAVDQDGDSVLVHGLTAGNGFLLRALAPMFRPGQQCATYFPSDDCPDPIGCMREGAVFGSQALANTFRGLVAHLCTYTDTDTQGFPPLFFSVYVQRNNAAAHCWMTLRLCGWKIDEIFSSYLAHNPSLRLPLERCNDAQLWRWAGIELLATRPWRPTDCVNLLHVAARSNNAVGVQQLVLCEQVHRVALHHPISVP
jgi:ankyrin repeat protein